MCVDTTDSRCNTTPIIYIIYRDEVSIASDTEYNTSGYIPSRFYAFGGGGGTSEELAEINSVIQNFPGGDVEFDLVRRSIMF